MTDGHGGAGPRENALLAGLPASERQLIREALERVPLTLKLTLEGPDLPASHLWFPTSGVASMVNDMEDGSVVEVATIGREGMVGLPIVFDAEQNAQRVFVQVMGEADRLSALDFRRLRDRLPALERLLARYSLSLMSQIAQGSACNRLHPIEARCARWLLQTHDRVDGDSFLLTHEFLAQMLGVTRPSVTIAAGILQRAGLISYARGVVDILDREKLEAASCECYEVINREFRRLVGPPRSG
ncbi:Crp/Fnr family transcriptional regulator [Roseococcus sp. SYP-B2431]|uniref:Crp/Fnr family transcriptional regulator n=1 Tax=Roseococcus sp. SYP-B2431 TaxID=2496640 RepID=UPI00103DFF42|nr:Crp/Fnr family transcriptional regulator [Roseococcus sp. SYP-B2431]TCI00159.1 Crp/Fnr family transcriptional regulator [Roseococcus sp. SYP-B2431]